MWQRGLIGSTANARMPSEKQSVFTSRREQLESVSSTRERSVDICIRLLPLDERLYLAPSASDLIKAELRRKPYALTVDVVMSPALVNLCLKTSLLMEVFEKKAVFRKPHLIVRRKYLKVLFEG
ncbi:hypothetical protein TNCV_1214921 [Trichonephila clavipes]|nr:hypothetical protein TNCV_1214921 [Trichonephila clavipes]